MFLGNPIYGTTDDYILSSFISGTYTGEKEKTLIFIEPLVSIFLHTFQTFFPQINIYSVFMSSILIITFTVMGIIVSYNKYQNKKSLYFLYLTFSTFSALWFFFGPTYTSASILGTSLNLLNLYLIYNLKLPKIINYIFNGFVSLILAVSILIRPESALVILALVIFIIFIHYIFSHNIILFKNILFSTLIVIFMVLINQIYSQKVSNQEWNNYSKWNSMRHQIQHRLSQNYLDEAMIESKWTIPEYHLFMDLAFADGNRFNNDWIKPAFDFTSKYRGITSIKYVDQKMVIDKIFTALNKNQVTIFIQLLLYLILGVFFRFKKFFIYSVILIQFPILLMQIYMIIFLHLPNRVFIPMLILQNFLLIFLNYKKLLEIKYFKISNAIYILLYSLTFIVGLITIQKHNLNNKNLYFKNKEISNFLYSVDPNGVFIGPGNTEIYHLNNPYLSEEKPNTPKIMTVGNWETFSPHWYKRLNFFGISNNSAYESLFKPGFYWIGYPQPNTSYLVELYLKEKGDLEVTRENIAEFSDGLGVFKYY
jgi:hypothetical protein